MYITQHVKKVICFREKLMFINISAHDSTHPISITGLKDETAGLNNSQYKSRQLFFPNHPFSLAEASQEMMLLSPVIQGMLILI